MNHSFRRRIGICCCLLFWPACSYAASDEALLETIKSVGPEGAGNRAASRAVGELIQRDAAFLPTLFAAMDDAGPLAANWLRGAIDAIAERELNAGRPLPAEQLEAYAVDRSHSPRARRLAFEWLCRADATAQERLIPDMLDDPSEELRRDAVARLLERAAALDKETQSDELIALYRRALTGAVHDDQVKAIVAALKEFGQDVNLQRHFGLLADWHFIGPFDNRDRQGFAAVYAPEREIQLSATYEGPRGEVSWAPLTTSDDYGLVDFTKQIEPFGDTVVYAVHEFTSPREQPVQLRLGTPNAWKLWLNGDFQFGHEEYHSGSALDQYRVDAVLRRGTNRILLKICQNEQKEDWAQRLQFQLRVCDGSGAAVLPEPPKAASRTESADGIRSVKSSGIPGDQ